MKSIMVPDDLHERLLLAKIHCKVLHISDVIIVKGETLIKNEYILPNEDDLDVT